MRVEAALSVAFVLSASFFAFGCSAVSMIINPYEKIALIAADDLNPDIYGRPSPVQVKLLHLRSRNMFDELDVNDLFSQSKPLLGDELLFERIYTLVPGEKIKAKLPIVSGTRYAAVVVAYRDIQHARWRHVVTVSDQLYYSRRYEVGRTAVMPHANAP